MTLCSNSRKAAGQQVIKLSGSGSEIPARAPAALEQQKPKKVFEPSSDAARKPLLEKWSDARNLDGSESAFRYDDVVAAVKGFEKELFEYARPDEHEVIKQLLQKHFGKVE